MSKGSHGAKFKPGSLKGAIFLGKRKDTSKSWVLVVVEGHFSTNLQGLRPNERTILRSLGQHASESPSKSASWAYMSHIQSDI